MIAAGLLGLVVSVVGGVVAWRFVDDLEQTSAESVQVSERALDAVDDTIDVADRALLAVDESVEVVVSTVDAVAVALRAATASVDDVAELAATVSPGLSDAEAAVRRLAGVGDEIDRVLGAVSSLPFGPSYDPDEQLGPTFDRLADSLGSIPIELDESVDGLDDLSTGGADVADDLADLAASIRSVSSELEESNRLTEEYRTTVADARRLAAGTASDLEGSATAMRVLVVLVAVTLLVAQVVPLWFGRELRLAGEEATYRASNDD